MTVAIQELAFADIPTYAELLQELDSERSMSHRDAQTLFRKIKQYPYYKIFCAWSAQEILATYSLIILDNFGHGGLKIAIVENVVVTPDAQGFGIGTTMMQDAMKRASDQGCYKLMLSSDLKRQGAHAFYEHLGFQQHGISFRTELNP
ncbi:GNAT family N-acetyltransferase [Sporolactobacillus sp. STCC-11]|uniref:GNAT family N-acetyltransferase n=1 Tax=Sporolactobacillus caesalpiniae TaxID=3230362 RepID=UPI0033989C92